MSPLARCHLYGILDTGYIAPQKMSAVAEEMIRGGIDVLQLRAKNSPPDSVREMAEALVKVVTRRVPLIINDHPEIAALSRSDGVHVGQDDLSVSEARRITGGGAVVGKSTHSVAQAVAAQEEGADYIGFGPIFATPTKPEYAPIW